MPTATGGPWSSCGPCPARSAVAPKAFTAHLHIKDWKRGGHAAGHEYGVIAGTGDGNIAYSIKGAVAMGYKGFAVMEPHLRGGGPTGGITGPDLFPFAVQAFRTILDEAWAKHD